MATGVDAVEALVEEALHDGLEPVDVGAVVRDQVVGVGVGVPLRGDPRRNVALHAAGVVAQAHHRTRGDFGFGKSRCDGAEVDGYAKKGKC